MSTIDWSAIGAIATIATAVLGVIGALAKWLMNELRRNTTVTNTIKSKVTTPDSVTGTIGEEVAVIANRSADHETKDDERFKKLWTQLGREEP